MTDGSGYRERERLRVRDRERERVGFGAGAGAVLLLLLGCSSGESHRTEGTAALGIGEAVLEVGALEGDSTEQLYRVQGVAPLADGGVAIANAGTFEIRLYDAAGTFVRALGREGEGPGEFGSLVYVQVRGDTVLGFDGRSARLSRYLTSGVHLGDVSVERTTSSFSIAGVLGDGSIVGWSRERAPTANGFARDSVTLLRYAANGSNAQVLGRFAGFERDMRVAEARGSIRSIEIRSYPFFRSFLAAVSGDRVYAAANDSAVVHVIDGMQTSPGEIRWEDRPAAFDAAYRARFIESGERRIEDPGARQRFRSYLEEMTGPPTVPVFDRLVAGRDGALWVRRMPDPLATDAEWLRFGADGTPAGVLTLPVGHEIQAATREHIYVLERDEFDVEYVRAYPVMTEP